MAHKSNDEFYLYTAFNQNASEGFQAWQRLTESGIQFKHLHYADPGQHDEVTSNVQTWFRDRPEVVVEFPFVTYVKVNEYSDPAYKQPEIVVGISNITATDWNTVFNFKG